MRFFVIQSPTVQPFLLRIQVAQAASECFGFSSKAIARGVTLMKQQRDPSASRAGVNHLAD